MASVVSLAGTLGLLLVSALPEVLGDRRSPDRRAHPGDAGQVGPAAAEPRRQSPPSKNQRERARSGALPLGALYTAAAVAFVLYKCLQQGKDEAAVLQEEADKKDSLQSEQHLAQLTQQLVQTEQHLNSLMAQLDPLFERVTTLAGAQQELLHMKLQTIHQLLQDSKPNKGVEVPEPGTGLGENFEEQFVPGERQWDRSHESPQRLRAAIVQMQNSKRSWLSRGEFTHCWSLCRGRGSRSWS
uniref:Coiled-coil domain containing 107 n=1 Tax=Bos taurus TaxID=9913 RepID=A0AAF6YWE7_BOVIN